MTGPTLGKVTFAGSMTTRFVGAFYSCAFCIQECERQYKYNLLNIMAKSYYGTVLADIMARVGDGLTRWSYGECANED